MTQELVLLHLSVVSKRTLLENVLKKELQKPEGFTERNYTYL